MIYDIYQLSSQIDTLVKKGSAESATQIRSIAEQLKTNLTEIEQNGNGNEDVISVTSLEVEAMHTVAIWTFTFHKKSDCVKVILKANFKPTYRPVS